MNDLRYALRQLRKNPLFTLIAVLTLALGIGIDTAIFSAAKETLRPSLPFRESERLVRIYQVPEGSSVRVSPRVPAFIAVRDGAESLESVVGSRFSNFTLHTPDGPERLVGNAVTAGWLETLGVQPALGRDFTPDEEAAGEGSGVVLVSHQVWRTRLGGSEDAVGSTLRLNGRPHVVVGVLPPGFHFPYDAHLWVPLRPTEADAGFWALNIPARLKPGVSVAAARADLAALTERVAPTLPGFTPGTTFTAVPIREVMVEDEGRTVLALAAAVGFLLLVVCANLANLLLARALARESEFAVRASLGASRGRLVRQSLVESTTLGLIGGALGLGVAYAAVDFLGFLLPGDFSYLGLGVRLDVIALVFAAALSIGTGLLMGILPALRGSATNPADAMREGGRSGGSRRRAGVGRGLVVAELAVTLVLLTGVGLMVRDVQRQQALDLGYEAQGLLVFSVPLEEAPYETGEARMAFAQRLLSELESRPDVATAGAVNLFPRHQGNTLAEVVPEGREPAPGERLAVNYRLVSAGYLESLGVPLLRGRMIAKTDQAGTQLVGLVSASLAERLWPGEDPVGKRVRDQRAGQDVPWVTVVGVVGDVRQSDDVLDSWYVPFAQAADSRFARQLAVVARGLSDNPPPVGTVRDALRAVDPELPIFSATTARALTADLLARERRGAWLGTAFGAFGLLLASLGIYGSISYAVARRTREFGLRMALGSDRRRILNGLLGEVSRMVLMGGAIGLAGAVILARVLGASLAEVGPFDPVAFGAALILLTLAALGAGLLPALRATRISPLEALRHE